MGKILVYYYLRNGGKGLEALLDINPMASGLLLVAGSEHSSRRAAPQSCSHEPNGEVGDRAL